MKNSYDILVNADVDEIFAVNNKEIYTPDEYKDVVVKGDNCSNSLIFKMNIVLDGVDISDKSIDFFYINAGGYSDIVPANATYIDGDYLLFSWLIDSGVTAEVGEVKYIIRVVGDNYMWKSKPATLKVIDTLDVNINPPQFIPSWAEDIENRLTALENIVNNSVSTPVDVMGISEVPLYKSYVEDKSAVKIPKWNGSTEEPITGIAEVIEDGN